MLPEFVPLKPYKLQHRDLFTENLIELRLRIVLPVDLIENILVFEQPVQPRSGFIDVVFNRVVLVDPPR